MKKTIFIIGTIAFLSLSVRAQQVVTVGGRVIIDHRQLSIASITSAPKPRDGASLQTKEQNETLYYYLEIAKTAVLPGRVDNWNIASTACTSWAQDGGGWRLPTQRESYSIVIHRNTLNAQPGFNALIAVSYWSATAGKDGVDVGYWAYYCGDFPIASVFVPYNTFSHVRCVRDQKPQIP